MIDIFLKEDCVKLMKEKSIVFLGDSNIRALYKDFLCLMTQSKLISDEKLRRKMEPSLFGDRLVYHGAKSNGRDYREERECTIGKTHISFYFLTRVFDKYVKSVLSMISSKRKPDVLVINCCLWDVTRWGAKGVDEYKLNVQELLRNLKLQLPNCLVIWMTAPPISAELKGGFLVNEIEFLKYSLRFHVMEANHFARKVVVANGFDVLDSHYHLKMQIHRRSKDGIHWQPNAVRYVTNLLLTHISIAWNVQLPHRYESAIMEKNLSLLENEINSEVPVAEKEPLQKELVSTTKPVNKENFQSKKQKQNQTPQKKAAKPNSHHAYMKNEERRKRKNRVRKWQNSPCAQPSPGPSAASTRYNSPVRYSPQQDSGYFPSPVDAALSNESYNFDRRNVTVTFNSPHHGYPYDCGPTAQESYTYGRPAYLLPNPLPSEPYHHYQIQDIPLPPSQCQFPQLVYMHNNPRLSIQPYSFPHVAQGQILRPRIDFTSDDFLFY